MKPVDEEVSVVFEIMKDPSENSMEGEEDIIDLVTVHKEKAVIIEGIVLGRITGFHRGGEPLIDYRMNHTGHPVAARSTIELETCHIGREAALMFEGGDAQKPIIIGLMHTYEKKDVTFDDKNHRYFI